MLFITKILSLKAECIVHDQAFQPPFHVNLLPMITAPKDVLHVSIKVRKLHVFLFMCTKYITDYICVPLTFTIWTLCLNIPLLIFQLHVDRVPHVGDHWSINIPMLYGGFFVFKCSMRSRNMSLQINRMKNIYSKHDAEHQAVVRDQITTSCISKSFRDSGSPSAYISQHGSRPWPLIFSDHCIKIERTF